MPSITFIWKMGNKKIIRDNQHISDDEIIRDIVNIRRDIRNLTKIQTSIKSSETDKLEADFKIKASIDLLSFCEKLLSIRHPETIKSRIQ